MRRPRRTVLVAAVCVGILGILGFDVAAKLAPIPITIPGTQSARSEAQLERHFGDSASFAVLLQGPADDLDRQGPKLVRVLRRDRRASVLSPWERRASAALRPAPEKALIYVDFHVPIGEAVNTISPRLERTIEAGVAAPVSSTVTGYPTLWRGLKSANETAAERGELIAFPLLLLVLLFVFRSPVAAVVPVLFGLATLISMRGLIALFSGWVEIDPLALPVSSMIGLALGVDYALLMVSRFREELAGEPDPARAAAITRRTAGRTAATAGATLFFSLLVALLIVPGRLFAELIGVVMVGTAVSVLIAWGVGPAVLALLGARVDRWRVGPPVSSRPVWMGPVERALRRPGLVSILVALPLLLLALPGLGLHLEASTIGQLPEDSSVRRNSEAVGRAVGQGWAGPFVAVVSSEEGSILEPRRARAIARWQRQISADPGVATAIGPRPIIKRLRPLRGFGNGLIADDGEGPLGQLGELGPKLGSAADGVSGLRSGMTRAAAGAGLLGSGSERARAGAGAIAEGLAQASDGGERAVSGIERLNDGARRLVAGQRGARLGALQLRLGLEAVAPNVGDRGVGTARQLREELRRQAAASPELRPEAQRAADLVVYLTKARNEIDQLRKKASGLHQGLTELAAGGEKLEQGTGRFATAAKGLERGIARLRDGSNRLAGALGGLSGGAQTLGSKLSEGVRRSSPLQRGLRKASVEVARENGDLESQLGSIRRFSPGIFNSGYFLVSALDGVRPGSRAGIEQTLNVKRGGQAIRILAIPKDPLNSPGAVALYDRLQSQAQKLEAEAGVTVGIAGGTAQLADYGRATRARIPILVLGILLSTLLTLVVFLRALWLSVLAALLNLGTVAVAFGALVLMGQIPAGYPLGGYGPVDVTGALSIFCIAFGLSIDYAVFLLMRMKESYARHGDHRRAIFAGLEKTGRVITGAAAIMTVVFVAFASSQIAVMTQIGVGLTVAVVLDATVVRLVLLPALMLIFGRGLWWFPGPPRWRRRLPGPEAARAEN